MSTPPELSCFDCPIVCEIGSLLGRSETVRDETVLASVHAMTEFEEIERSGGDPTALRERWQQTSTEIFGKLDNADKTLATNRTGLIETCDDGQPTIVEAAAEGEDARLRCSSALSVQVMQALGISVQTN